MDKDQVAVLKAFYDVSYDYYCFGYDWLKDVTGLDRKPAYKAVHALMKLGYVGYHKGLFTEDGLTAGSGFMINHERKADILNLLKSEGVDLDD